MQRKKQKAQEIAQQKREELNKLILDYYDATQHEENIKNLAHRARQPISLIFVIACMSNLVSYFSQHLSERENLGLNLYLSLNRAEQKTLIARNRALFIAESVMIIFNLILHLSENWLQNQHKYAFTLDTESNLSQQIISLKNFLAQSKKQYSHFSNFSFVMNNVFSFLLSFSLMIFSAQIHHPFLQILALLITLSLCIYSIKNILVWSRSFTKKYTLDETGFMQNIESLIQALQFDSKKIIAHHEIMMGIPLENSSFILHIEHPEKNNRYFSQNSLYKIIQSIFSKYGIDIIDIDNNAFEIRARFTIDQSEIFSIQQDISIEINNKIFQTKISQYTKMLEKILETAVTPHFEKNENQQLESELHFSVASRHSKESYIDWAVQSFPNSQVELDDQGTIHIYHIRELNNHLDQLVALSKIDHTNKDDSFNRTYATPSHGGFFRPKSSPQASRPVIMQTPLIPSVVTSQPSIPSAIQWPSASFDAHQAQKRLRPLEGSNYPLYRNFIYFPLTRDNFGKAKHGGDESYKRFKKHFKSILIGANNQQLKLIHKQMRDHQGRLFYATAKQRLLGKHGDERVYYSEEIAPTGERLFLARLYEKKSHKQEHRSRKKKTK